VIEGHNMFRSDLPYLVGRAKKLKTKLNWDAAAAFSDRVRHDCKSRRKPSITQSSQSMAVTSSIHFCSPNSTTLACAPWQVSSARTWPGTSISATANKSHHSRARNWSVHTWTIQKYSAAALFAAFGKRGRYPTC